MAGPLKIYPTVEECQIKNKVICPIEDCNENFTSESILNLHLAKTHKTMVLKSSLVEKWYFCPQDKCPWNSSKHFRSLKNVRQHFLKMHMEKSFSCISCQKPFPSESMLANHTKYCSIAFSCLDCKASYGCYDTLKTHCRRKNHKLLSKEDYRVKHDSKQLQSDIYLGSTGRPLLPKKCSEELLKVKQVTQHTQTGTRNNVFSVETQTVENIKSKQDSLEENYKNINTQTDTVESKETSCNTSFDIDEFEFAFNNHIEKNSSSTQTQWPNGDIFTISNAPDLLSDSLSNFDTNSFFNCNSETQTDLMFDNEIFNSDYYSHMHTQTCDEILSGLNGFTDIQTQTVLNDTLRSVESQTLMSSVDRLCPSIFKDIVHSETQTDTEFRQMLEIINS